MVSSLCRRAVHGAIFLSFLVICVDLGLAAETASLPLAIRGYDPVAYFTQGRPTRGLPDFEYAWDGYRYHFVTAESRDLFKADPAHYAPQFEGLCAIALADGYKDVADPENWLISDNKLYLFGGQRGPGRFGADVPGNDMKANETWLKLQR